MIELNKEDPPEVLRENSEDWKEEYLRRRNGEDTPSPKAVLKRLKREEIRGRLRDESYEKCVYCESKMRHVSFDRIEHITPKADFPELAFDWDNLCIACERCNNEKGDYYSNELPLINPFEDDPRDFVVAEGPMIRKRIGEDRGWKTIEQLDLNRLQLIEKRLEKIQDIRETLDLAKEKQGATRQGLIEQAKEKAEKDKEFSFIAKAFLDCAT